MYSICIKCIKCLLNCNCSWVDVLLTLYDWTVHHSYGVEKELLSSCLKEDRMDSWLSVVVCSHPVWCLVQTWRVMDVQRWAAPEAGWTSWAGPNICWELTLVMTSCPMRLWSAKHCWWYRVIEENVFHSCNDSVEKEMKESREGSDLGQLKC